MKLISIIIPVHNRTDRFRGALSSAVAQSYSNIEIIVVDDGSFSHAIEYAMRDILKFQKYDAQKEKNSVILSRIENIQYIRQEHKGAPTARNKGFALSKGDYVFFWDADVVAEPDMIETLADTLDKHPGAGYAYCNHYLGFKKIPSRAFDAELLRKNNYITTMSLIRREVFPGFDENLKKFQDWDLWLTMLEKGIEGVWCDEYLFRALPGGTMSTWIPSSAYKKPWKFLPWIRRRVERYEEAREIIFRKHELNRIQI